MSREGREKARKVLGKDPNRKSTSPIATWFDKNPDARDFVDVWLEMTEEGTCSQVYTMTRIHLELIENYGYPFTSQCGFARWCSRIYGERYHDAVAQFRRGTL